MSPTRRALTHPMNSTLRAELATAVNNAIDCQGLEISSAWAAEHYRELGFRRPVTLTHYVQALRLGRKIYKPSYSKRVRTAPFTKQELIRFAKIMFLFSIPSDHPAIEQVREKHHSFKYPPPQTPPQESE